MFLIGKADLCRWIRHNKRCAFVRSRLEEVVVYRRSVSLRDIEVTLFFRRHETNIETRCVTH